VLHGVPVPPLQQMGSPAGQLFWQLTAVVPLQVQIPAGEHVLHAVFGCAESELHPPHAFMPALGLLHVTLLASAHVYVPPPQAPHGVLGWVASVMHPPHALTPAFALEHATASVPEQAHIPPPQVPQLVFG
jgi:hypothetical protein